VGAVSLVGGMTTQRAPCHRSGRRGADSLPTVTPDLERLLSLHVDDGLGRRSLEELRRLRGESQDWEAAVSLARRLAQGRLDIVRHERRRRDGTLPVDAESPHLLFDLPDILAESHGGSTGRALSVRPPGRYGEDLIGQLDGAADPHRLCRSQDISDLELAALDGRLVAFEAEASRLRRALHRQLDALSAEIGRRYRDGEATVETSLG
jgi:hypothetical protein